MGASLISVSAASISSSSSKPKLNDMVREQESTANTLYSVDHALSVVVKMFECFQNWLMQYLSSEMRA
jgi:hypothetical protein